MPIKWTFPSDKRCYYKVTHHCSNTGADSALLRGLHPDMAATSRGEKNKYKHPHVNAKQLVEQYSRAHRLTHRERQTISLALRRLIPAHELLAAPSGP